MMARLTNEELFQGLWNRRERLSHLREHFSKSNGWSVLDIRLTVFAKIENVVGSTALGLESLTEFLPYPRKHFDGRLYPPIPNDVGKEFNNYLRLAFVQFLFSSIESSMRALLRAINPKACSNATSEFKLIYDYLLGKELNLTGAQNFINMLDLFRLIRNSLHNNGMHLNKSAVDSIVVYREATYVFKNAQHLDFIYWDLKLLLLDDVIALIELMLDHPKIKNLSFIKDAFAS